MCLIINTNSSETQHYKIATKPIKVWKVLKMNSDGKTFSGPYFGYKYIPGHEYHTKIGNPYLNRIFMYAVWCVDNGFHSYGLHTVSRARKVKGDVFIGTNFYHRDDGFYVVECTIPEGAKYFEGNRGDYVSDRIITGDRIIPVEETVRPGFKLKRIVDIVFSKLKRDNYGLNLELEEILPTFAS